MRVLFGTASEGLGHATRSGVVRDHLVSNGHSVTFACAKSRASAYLGKYGPVVQIPGLGTRMARGKLDPVRAFLGNIPSSLLIGASPLYLMSLPKPDLVISDFEPCVARYAKMLGIPLISIGNIEFLSRCSHPRPLADGMATWVPVINAVVPNAFHYFVTSFASANVLNPGKTSLHLPILRPGTFQSCQARDNSGDVVVYFNDLADWSSILPVLAACAPTKFRVYGTGKSGALGNVTLFPPGDNFLADLACAKAVFGGAGFTLVTECIYSGKPLFALPFEGHFEQILNANYLEKMGYGERCRELTPESLKAFLERAPSYAQNLEGVSHDQNVELFSALDRMLGC